jgi:hypothetical protein
MRTQQVSRYGHAAESENVAGQYSRNQGEASAHQRVIHSPLEIAFSRDRRRWLRGVQSNLGAYAVAAPALRAAASAAS